MNEYYRISLSFILLSLPCAIQINGVCNFKLDEYLMPARTRSKWNARQTPSWRRAASSASRSCRESMAARCDAHYFSLVSAKPVMLELYSIV
eukprot:3680141-Pleurochrysis_carterae.AAC.1